MIQYGPLKFLLMPPPLIHGWWWVSDEVVTFLPDRMAPLLVTFYQDILFMAVSRPGAWGTSPPLPRVSVRKDDIILTMQSRDGRLVPWWLLWYFAKIMVVQARAGFGYLFSGSFVHLPSGLEVVFRVAILIGGVDTRPLELGA